MYATEAYMRTTYLEKISKTLEKQNSKYKDTIFNYAIPDFFNFHQYRSKKMIKTNEGHLIVNPYDFYHSLIQDYYLKQKNDLNYLQSLSMIKKDATNNGDWIKKSVVYSMMIRTSTTYDSDRSSTIDHKNMYGLNETGSFLKTLALLPTLKEMGVDVIYLLPISKYSLKDKKGELGSPYGVSNFFKIDEGLKDKMLPKTISVEDEFKAFVEACHILDMKVIIDIIPRTNSVNSDLIADHPDWFYWIKLEDLADYKPPFVPNVGQTVPPTAEYLKDIYQSPEVLEHINKFIYDPKTTDPLKWEAVIKKWHEGKQELLDVIQENLKITIAPAFSDHINDPQPAWSDVTFFRMYKDHPENSKKYLKDLNTPPYILFDTIKSNLHPGKEKNQELWDTLANIIPYYQTNFGIDGARIDMGHALPLELVKNIIDNAKAIDPNFCFIAEELDLKNAKASKEKGYNMIIGNAFTEVCRLWDHRLHAFFYNVPNLELPVFACGETHDTPRLAAREGGKILSKMITIMNLFLPNAVPFINSGQELYEIQPMNTGLDCRENEAFLLDEDDPQYGKLALFDKYSFHYHEKDRFDLINEIIKTVKIRNKYLNSILDLTKFVPLGFDSPADHAIGLGFIASNNIGIKDMLIVVCNTDVYTHHHFSLKLYELRAKTNNFRVNGQLLYSTHEQNREIYEFDEYNNLNLSMQPGEVKIILIKR